MALLVTTGGAVVSPAAPATTEPASSKVASAASTPSTVWSTDSSAAPAAAAKPLRVWRAYQFNFCGTVDNRDLCTVEGRNGKYVNSLRARIVTFKPQVVTLNEICRAQYVALKRKLARSGWEMYGSFVTTHRAASLSCPDRRHGNALLTRRVQSRLTIDCLSGCLKAKTQVEHRVGMCVSIRLQIRTRVCVVHIGTTLQDRQIADFIHELDMVARRMPVLIGGDFNREPGYEAMDPVYFAGGRGASGQFEEADACRLRVEQTQFCNESTRLRRKLDYVFLARRWFRDVRADAGAASYSDHDPLHAWFKQCAAKVC
jgi:endonuclease/exonuclease/phosphatase family metal-dependent hydrolase